MKTKINQVRSRMRASKHLQHPYFRFPIYFGAKVWARTLLLQRSFHRRGYSAMFPVGKSSCCDVRLTDWVTAGRALCFRRKLPLPNVIRDSHSLSHPALCTCETAKESKRKSKHAHPQKQGMSSSQILSPQRKIKFWPKRVNSHYGVKRDFF